MEHLKSYFAGRPEILLAYLFGSAVTKRTHKLSDIDLAIYSEPILMRELNNKQPYGYQAAILIDLMSLLRRNDIDLVILNRAKPLLAYEIVRSGDNIFCRSENFRTEYEIKTFQKYMDTKKLRDIQDFYLIKRIKHGLFAKI